MALLGTGAVAIWHDITPEGRDNFYAWHGREHMPERVGIPGFHRGRRYVASRADLEFFNLYEVENPALLAGDDYRARLNTPTPWTVESVKHFRDVARSLCRVAVSAGEGGGGLAATWRYDVMDDDANAHIAAMANRVFLDLAEHPHIAGTHLLVADIEASAVDTAERKARGTANRIPGWIVVVEGWGDEGRFVDLCESQLSDSVLAEHGAAGPATVGFYRLQATALPALPG
ncbi:MAG: hypothetical protein GY798_11415 [Hyphomicrobiales bacterium]|nr:hypothetical protein [Hyphomicrobiales bacterium]